MTSEERIKVLKALCDHQHRRILELQNYDEAEAGIYVGYDKLHMNKEDRLMNRLVANLIYAHADVSADDDEALRWIKEVLHG